MLLRAVVVTKRLECGGFSTALAWCGNVSGGRASNQTASLKTTHSKRFARFKTANAFAAPPKSLDEPTMILPITFTPADTHDSWTQPISSVAAESAKGARASARFTVIPMDALRSKTPQNLSRRSRLNAARQIAYARNRYERRRFFAPNHAFEHRLP